MSDKKEPNPNEIPIPHAEMRAALEASRDVGAAATCERIEDLLDNVLRALCARKQFELTSGNCKKECQTIEEPKIEPCLRLRWGDGPNDHLETDDTEILCITVCNPYSNVVLKEFNLQLIVTDASGNPVPNQADGTPSVIIKPQFNVCFDDIPPCDPQRPNRNCVSREFVMINRGAKAGQYKVFVVYCFEACFTKVGFNPAAFVLDLVTS
jgi:hypothetical protein